MTDCQLIAMKYFTGQYRGDNSMRAYQLIAFLIVTKHCIRQTTLTDSAFLL